MSDPTICPLLLSLGRGLAVFDGRFETVLADTPRAREINHRIRYLVYCLETGYESRARYPDGLERDAWDENAAHFLVRRRDNGEWIAAMRLVLPGAHPLPIESLCALDRRLWAGALRSDVAEVSRLCVVERYRRRSRERQAPFEIPAGADRRRRTLPVTRDQRARQRRHGPEIMLGLLLAAAAYSQAEGLRHWLFLTSQSLCRMVEQYGVPLQLAGAPCEHRGERHPYVVDLAGALTALWKRDPRLAGWLERRPAVRRYSELTAPSAEARTTPTRRPSWASAS